jgi:hypothetical protein
MLGVYSFLASTHTGLSSALNQFLDLFLLYAHDFL